MKKFVRVLLNAIITCSLFSVASMAMETNDIPRGKVLIKSKYSREFLYDHNTGEFAWIHAKKSISKESVFIIEKKDEGFVIKNSSTGNYLYSNDRYDNKSCASNEVGKNELNFSFRTILGHGNIKSNSYFDIIKKDNEYVIKSKRHSDYVFIGPIMPGQGWTFDKDGPYVIANNYVNNTSCFTFIPYSESFETLFN